MVLHNRHDAILVRIVHYEDDGEETYVASYYTTAISETLKMFITARDNDISCCFNETTDEVADRFKDSSGFLIEDVYINFGTIEDMPVIGVII